MDDARLVFIIANERPCDLITEDDADEPIVCILDKTPFYGEMGGQVGDVGELIGDGFRFEVVDAQVNGALILHRGHLREGRMELGATVSARVDATRRDGIRRAHSATHLLHYALRKRLGEHALQQGSKVDDDLLRFDFANPSAVRAEELAAIEDEVNEKILAGEPIRSATMPLAEARKSGAMMLFGEKYPDVVRMISIGGFSKELCGGTHLDNAAKIGLMKIVGEESVAAGTRRITALTGRAALDHLRRAQAALARAAAALRVSPEETPDRVEALVKELKQAKKLSAAGGKSAAAGVDQLLAAATKLGETTVVIAETAGGAAGLAATDRPVAPQGVADRRHARREAGGGEGDVGGRVEPRPGRAGSRRGCLGPRGGRVGRRQRRRRPARHGPGRRQERREAARGACPGQGGFGEIAGRVVSKYEIRSTKSETNSKLKIRMTKTEAAVSSL